MWGEDQGAKAQHQGPRPVPRRREAQGAYWALVPDGLYIPLRLHANYRGFFRRRHVVFPRLSLFFYLIWHSAGVGNLHLQPLHQPLLLPW